VRLQPDDIEAIAERVVERLSQQGPRGSIGFATAAEVAELYGVTPSWVYANKNRLGAVKLGDGPKARLRFDLERVDEELRRRAVSRPGPHQRIRRGRPRKTALPPGVELLRGRRVS
jgi:hypothetical protein